MKFNRLLALVGACATFGLVACGDDSSSSGGRSESVDLSIIAFDEATRTIVYYQENEYEFCVLDEATKSASWKTINQGNDTSTINYDFVTLSPENVAFIKDSLKVSVSGNTAMNIKRKYSYGGYEEEYSMGLYVGGDASSAKGTWVSVPCNSYDGEVECRVRDGWEKVTLKVSSNSIHADMEYISFEDDDYDYDDYDYYTDDISQSGLIVSLYQMLADGYGYFVSGYNAIENYGDNVQSIASSYNVEVKSKSRSSETFVVNNKTYELDADDFGIDDYGDLTINLTLSSDGKTCSYNYENGDLEGRYYNKNACRSDLYDYYRTEDVKDYTGKVYTYGYEYRRDNSNEFESCVKQMAGLSTTTPSYDLYKKSAKKISDAEFWSDYKSQIRRALRLFK